MADATGYTATWDIPAHVPPVQIEVVGPYFVLSTIYRKTELYIPTTTSKEIVDVVKALELMQDPKKGGQP